jgi:serine/threonine protein kinase
MTLSLWVWLTSEVGNWAAATEIPPIYLERLEVNLKRDLQALFLRFMRRMLQWRPEDRASAKELLSDPWLRSPCSLLFSLVDETIKANHHSHKYSTNGISSG